MFADFNACSPICGIIVYSTGIFFNSARRVKKLMFLDKGIATDRRIAFFIAIGPILFIEFKMI